MRIYQCYSTKYLLTGNKPFCLIQIGGANLSMNEKKCSVSECVSIQAYSLPESVELLQLFRSNGFQAEESRGIWEEGLKHEKNFIDPYSLSLSEENMIPDGNCAIFIYNVNKKKFLEFLKVLSKNYGYKTFYRSGVHAVIK